MSESNGCRPHTGARTEDDLPVDVSAEEMLELAARTAEMAGDLLLERSLRSDAGEEGIASKSTPTDLVSDADRASQRCIRESLAEHRPQDGFLGEEEGDDTPGVSGLQWVVDPLDGTVNFLFGLPQWCVSVAVRDARGVIAGAIYDPTRDQLFSATREGRAMLAGKKEAIALGDAHAARPRASDLASAMIATGFAYDARVRAAQAQVLERVIPHVRDIRRFGSAALDLAWTALGRYDAYFERTVKPWDIAAGTLLCEAVGLQVVELPAHENLPWGILVAPPALCEPLLELVG